MSMQQIMRWVHDFLRIMGWNIQTFEANGEKPNVKGRTHKKCQLPFLSYSPNHLLRQKLVELVIAWDG